MLDRYALKLAKPVIDRTALAIKNRGYSADQVTFAGFGLGLFAALCIALGFYAFAILPLLASRALDGLDGAVARAGVATDRGAFLDIGLDFVFYGLIPLAFGVANPEANALAAATLLGRLRGHGLKLSGLCHYRREARPEEHGLSLRSLSTISAA